MAAKVICDTGPLAGFFNRNDQFHAWAKEQFDHIHEPLLTCEAVISETVFLLQDDGLRTDPVFEAIDRGQLRIAFSLESHWPAVRRLLRKYEDVPISMADGCLVRMSELIPDCRVLTADRDFRLYRRNGRNVIPLLAPFDR